MINLLCFVQIAQNLSVLVSNYFVQLFRSVIVKMSELCQCSFLCIVSWKFNREMQRKQRNFLCVNLVKKFKALKCIDRGETVHLRKYVTICHRKTVVVQKTGRRFRFK